MSPRFLIAGNCQIAGLSQCLRRRLPGAQVDTLALNYRMTQDEIRAAAGKLAACDHFIAQAKVMRNFPHVVGEVRPVSLIPSVLFSGFHPDVIRPATRKGKIPSPMGAMNSRIAMAGFLLGLSEARTAGLFNAYVYRRLGYFDEFARAAAYQGVLHAQAGWDLGDTIARWRAGGVFMHQTLHPKIAVLDDIVASLLRRLGEPVAEAALPPDNLSEEAVWPVYPELARDLAVEGSMAFRPAGEAEIDLEAFIAGSFAFYRRRPPDVLVGDEVLAAYRLLRPLVA